MFASPTGVRLLLHLSSDDRTPMQTLLLEAKPVLLTRTSWEFRKPRPWPA